ncbi:uncharacterized protein rassf11 [Synchiropus picturatus]
MEVTVYVDGVPRVVSGLTEETSCREVVTVLAQALGQPGRYMLQERFKDFQRCMSATECVVETLKKYGEQAREVQLSLLHGGPSVWDEMSRANVGRHQAFPPLRRKEAAARVRRGSSSLSLHRRSLPPLTDSRPETSQELKKPKRKSLTFMEEAWGWLESLGKTRVYSTDPEKQRKRGERKNRSSLENFLEDRSEQVRGQKPSKSDLELQTSCCMGSQARMKEEKQLMIEESRQELSRSTSELNNLRDTIVHQLAYIQAQQLQIARVDKDISQLERRQEARRGEQEAQQMIEDELEQIRYWQNALKAEENFEQELKHQFFELKSRAAQCKALLEEYRLQMHSLDASAAQEEAVSAACFEPDNPQGSDEHQGANIDRKSPPRETCTVPPCQIRGRRPTGPTELREWWKRWSEAQSSRTEKKKKVIHRTELTVYLAGSKA